MEGNRFEEIQELNSSIVDQVFMIRDVADLDDVIMEDCRLVMSMKDVIMYNYASGGVNEDITYQLLKDLESLCVTMLKRIE